MPNVTPAKSPTNAASQRALPVSLKAALADPFALGDEAAHLWRPPAVLPPVADIATGISILEAQLQGVDRQHASYCLAKMAVGFNERRTNGEAQIVLETWLEIVGDVPNDLWSTATMELLQTWSRDKHFGRMPEPSDFRAVVSAQMQRRENELARSRLMLKAHSAQVEEAREKPIETRLGRMEHTRSIYARLNRMTDVRRIDREIAVEKGEPVPVDTNQAGLIYAGEERPPFVPNTSPSAQRTAQLAAQWRGEKPGPAATNVPLSAPGSDDWDRHEVV